MYGYIRGQEYQEVILEFCPPKASIATIVILNKELTRMCPQR